MHLDQTRAIVTGGASGLGAATARVLRAAGAKVTIFDRDGAGARAVAEEIGAGHVAVDVTDADSVAAGIAQAVSAMGGLNALVNCAGIAIAERTLGRDGPHDLGRFRKVLDVNLAGSFNCIRLAAAEIAKAPAAADGCRGVIVNTASVAAFDGQKGQAAYAASKAGIAGMTLPLARDFASLGLRVCTIAPGVFLTPMLEGLGAEVQQSLAAEVTCPKRLGRPEEFGELVRFILSADYLNGEVIRLDGALRMH